LQTLETNVLDFTNCIGSWWSTEDCR